MYVKKTEHQRTDAFKLWYWRRLLRVPWIVKRSNQSILKEINPEYLLERLILKLKLQYFGHLMQSWLIGKDPDARKDWRQEEKGTTEDKMVGSHHQLDGHEFWTGKPGILQSIGSQRVRRDRKTEQQRFWTTFGRKPVFLGVLKLNYFSW